MKLPRIRPIRPSRTVQTQRERSNGNPVRQGEGLHAQTLDYIYPSTLTSCCCTCHLCPVTATEDCQGYPQRCLGCNQSSAHVHRLDRWSCERSISANRTDHLQRCLG